MSESVAAVLADMNRLAEKWAQIARKQPTVRLGHGAAAEVLFEFADRVKEANQAERDGRLGEDARNCERYGSHEEAREVFDKFCTGDCGGCRFGGSDNCYGEWLMAKAGGTEKGEKE